jgi:hypothetical protein
MHRPNIAIRSWLANTTPSQAKAMAKAAGTSVPHLRHIAAGRRQMSADLAQRIAHSASEIPDTPELYQTDLCSACRRCPLLNGK